MISKSWKFIAFEFDARALHRESFYRLCRMGLSSCGLKESAYLRMNFWHQPWLPTNESRVTVSSFFSSNMLFAFHMIMFLLTCNIFLFSQIQCTKSSSSSSSFQFLPPPSTRCLLACVTLIFSRSFFHSLTRLGFTPYSLVPYSLVPHSLVFQIVGRSHWWFLYLRMLGKGLLLNTTALLVFFLWLVKSLKNL